MNKKLSICALALMAASTVFAQFEGIIETKITATDGNGAIRNIGTMSVAISKAGTRSEMNSQIQGMGMNMVMLLKNDNPDLMYRINEANKTYTEVDLAKLRAMAPSGQALPEEIVTVKKLGEEKILGYNTQHVLVTQNGTPIEMWTAKDFLDYATYSKLQARRGRPGSGEAMLKALKDAGAEGMPLKSISNSPDGGKAIMEVVKAEKKSLPASTFEIPAGYTKTAGGMMDMMGGMSGPQADEARKRMEEAMKNMPPEQREMMEKMMKQRGAAGGQ